MGQALYRKYRSRSLNDIVGQEHITKTLKSAIQQGRINHAYLLTGPKGVGKTSVARILAHEINGLPYDDDSSHIDIIEIDAASNRRIDEIRELREKVYVAPTSAKYKVYIIDEVHMLTREAFNALLKTLEEPPAHVIFILATTDAHKLPETIISRTQRFNFRPAESSQIVELLRSISETEQFKIDDLALELIAKHASGSFRDSVSLLDQATSQATKVQRSDIENLLGLPPSAEIDNLINIVAGDSSAKLMQALSSMYDQGITAFTIASQLGLTLRQKLINSNLPMEPELVLKLLNSLIEVPASFDPERALEIALLSANPGLFNATVVEKVTQPMEAKAETELNADTIEETTVQEPVEAEAEKIMPSVKQDKSRADTKAFNEEVWPEILKALKKQYNTLYGLVRMSQPDFSEANKLKLAFAFSFHQKRLNEKNNRQKLVDIIYSLTGQAVDISCIVDKSAQPPKLIVEVEAALELKKTKNESPAGDLSTINNIFGNAELLES